MPIPIIINMLTMMMMMYKKKNASTVETLSFVLRTVHGRHSAMATMMMMIRDLRSTIRLPSTLTLKMQRHSSQRLLQGLRRLLLRNRKTRSLQRLQKLQNRLQRMLLTAQRFRRPSRITSRNMYTAARIRMIFLMSLAALAS